MKYRYLKNYLLPVFLLLTALSFIITGCEQRNSGAKGGSTPWATNEQYKLLLPAKIDILPFTKPRSWDDDQIPDGIEVVLRPLDSFGDQTKAVGCFRFELYTFQKASGETKGQRIGFWEENMTTKESQNLHWDKITRTYRFRLAWTGEKTRQGKYVLEVTYLAPSSLRLTDTYIMEARVSKEQTKENIEKKQKSNFKLF
ncbi:MAG: hypothetical protein WC975_14630 [Phycisphaerae bacterium]